MSKRVRQAAPLEPERQHCAKVEMFGNHSRDRGSSMNITTYGLDLAKRVFQVHWVEPETGEVKRKVLRRGEVAAFFARRIPGVVAMESCGSAHHWGRLLSGLGHRVQLIAAQFCQAVREDEQDRRSRCRSDLGSSAASRDALCLYALVE